ncbi:hypothetical protein ACEPAH_301 [Sanghuangporus vaninii]
MKHPDLNASGSSKVFTGFDDAFGVIDGNGRSGREVGKYGARRAAIFDFDGKPVLFEASLLLVVGGIDTEHARGDGFFGICLFCCLGWLSGDGAWTEGFKVAVAERV